MVLPTIICILIVVNITLIESGCNFACDEIAPVCCVSALSPGYENGYTWSNWCLAQCGANDFDNECDIRGSCSDLINYDQCIFDEAKCEQTWDPVCCMNSDGKYENIANECMAKCKYPDTYNTVCGSDNCQTTCCHD